MAKIERADRGRFAPGSTPNPNGRPTRERERAYLHIMKEIVTADNWRNLVAEAYLGARGMRLVLGNDGKPTQPPTYERDPLATPASKIGYLRFIADYVAGRPTQPLLVDAGKGELLDEWLGLSEDALDDIIELAYGKSNKILSAAKAKPGKGKKGAA